MSSSVEKSRRRRLSPEQRRSELVAVGTELFATHTYDDVRMEDVARAASVSRALLYRYFPDKPSLFVAVVDAVGDKMLQRTAAEIDSAASPFQQARTAVLGYLKAYEDYPTIAQASFQETIATDSRMLNRDKYDRRQQSALVVNQIQLLNGSGLGSLGDRMLSLTATAWMGFVEQAIRSWVLAPTVDRDVVADICAHALLDAVLRVPGLTESAKQQLMIRDSPAE